MAFKSQVVSVGTTPVALTPPGTKTDRAPGYSVIVFNTSGLLVVVGGSDAQDAPVAIGDRLPISGAELAEVLYIKTTSGAATNAGTIVALWQGVTAS